MHAITMIPDFFKSQNPHFHKSRLKGVAIFADAICHGATLTMTGLGRAINAPSEKEGIKRSYEFLTNSLLYRETQLYGAVLAKCVIGNILHPIILIDWTEMPNTNKQIQALTASIPRRGRSQPIYSKTYTEKQYNTEQAHEEFIKNLAAVLPRYCKPVIVTDAGFRGPWCKTIASMGWYYVTRVRNNSHIKFLGNQTWLKLANEYKLDENAWIKSCVLNQVDNSGFHFFGDAILNKSKNCHFNTKIYFYKKKPKGRKDKGKLGQVRKQKDSRKNAKSNSEPWILSTNIPDEGLPEVTHPINIYKQRMKIEETFRDMKSARFGASMSFARSSCLVTWSNLLLLASIALLLLYVIGMHAEKINLHYKFQANTVQTRRVLSFTFLGRRVIESLQKTANNSLLKLIVLSALDRIICAG